MSAHLKAPWRIVERETLEDGSAYPRHVATEAGDYQICLLESPSMAALGYTRTVAEAERDAVIAAAPELLAAVESEYIYLADIHNEWPGRHTAEGQQKLCRLRDLICKATGHEAQDVQDGYGNRNLAAGSAA